MVFLTSGNLQPQSIVKSLVPSLNTLVLFEVSPVSFHQVGRCWCLTAYEPRYTLVTRVCICRGCRGFDEGQVSSVSEWLVPRPVLRASTSPRGCPHSTEPTFTERCKFELTLATMGFNDRIRWLRKYSVECEGSTVWPHAADRQETLKMLNPSSNTAEHHLHTGHNSLERKAMFKYGIDLFI